MCLIVNILKSICLCENVYVFVCIYISIERERDNKSILQTHLSVVTMNCVHSRIWGHTKDFFINNKNIKSIDE